MDELKERRAIKAGYFIPIQVLKVVQENMSRGDVDKFVAVTLTADNTVQVTSCEMSEIELMGILELAKLASWDTYPWQENPNDHVLTRCVRTSHMSDTATITRTKPSRSNQNATDGMIVTSGTIRQQHSTKAKHGSERGNKH